MKVGDLVTFVASVWGGISKKDIGLIIEKGRFSELGGLNYLLRCIWQQSLQASRATVGDYK